MKYFALWFEAPFQSWGCESKFGLRTTFSFPTKSGIAGIVLSSLGRGGEEKDFLQRFSDLEEFVVSYSLKDAVEFILTDFQTVGNGYASVQDPWMNNMVPKKRDGGSAAGLSENAGSKLTYRQYLQDSFFGVVQEIPEDLCAEIEYGLTNPIWPVYLGRRCCVPTYPIYQGTFDSKEDAFVRISSIAYEKGLCEKEHLVEGLSEDAYDSFFIMDVPVVFGKRKRYRDRLVSVIRPERRDACQ